MTGIDNWKAAGKSVSSLIEELKSFGDQNMPVKISIDDGESLHDISLVGKVNDFAVVMRCSTESDGVCCYEMNEKIDLKCEAHPNKFECPDAIIDYNEIFDEYGVIIHDGGQSVSEIKFCPYCGAKLPESKRDRWYQELEEKGFSDPFGQVIPAEYKSKSWWSKCGQKTKENR